MLSFGSTCCACYFFPKNKINITEKREEDYQRKSGTVQTSEMNSWTIYIKYECKLLQLLRNLHGISRCICLLATQAAFLYLQVSAAAAIASALKENKLGGSGGLLPPYPLSTHLPAEIAPGCRRPSKKKVRTQVRVFGAFI